MKAFANVVLAMAVTTASPSPAKPAKCALARGITAAEGARTLCGFDMRSKRFAGTSVEQARCLTRHVGRGAVIGATELPDGLAALVGRPTGVGADQLSRYAAAHSLLPQELGGPLGRQIAADYFIIHDTSYPNCSSRDASRLLCPVANEFPAVRDEVNWPANRNFEGRPRAAPNRIANVFTNRVGGSITEVDFAEPFYTTKFEQCEGGGAPTGAFVGVENVQPRLTYPRPTPPGRRINDAQGPEPGFPRAQYSRLALLYVVASARRGVWLVPAYHAVIDSYYYDRHDDPQKFDVAAFDAAVSEQVQRIMAMPARP